MGGGAGGALAVRFKPSKDSFPMRHGHWPCSLHLLLRRVVTPDLHQGCGWVVHGIDTLLSSMPGTEGVNTDYLMRGGNSGST